MSDVNEDPMAAFARQWQAMADAWTAEMRKVTASLTAAMTEFWASPSGQYLKAVVDYYERHPEELDAMIAAREAEARRRFCDCMCGRWKHRGACLTDATTERVFSLGGDPATVPLCGPCAASIDGQRAVLSR
jgi:hypothetical protein